MTTEIIFTNIDLEEIVKLSRIYNNNPKSLLSIRIIGNFSKNPIKFIEKLKSNSNYKYYYEEYEQFMYNYKVTKQKIIRKTGKVEEKFMNTIFYKQLFQSQRDSVIIDFFLEEFIDSTEFKEFEDEYHTSHEYLKKHIFLYCHKNEPHIIEFVKSQDNWTINLVLLNPIDKQVIVKRLENFMNILLDNQRFLLNTEETEKVFDKIYYMFKNNLNRSIENKKIVYDIVNHPKNPGKSIENYTKSIQAFLIILKNGVFIYTPDTSSIRLYMKNHPISKNAYNTIVEGFTQNGSDFIPLSVLLVKGRKASVNEWNSYNFFPIEYTEYQYSMQTFCYADGNILKVFTNPKNIYFNFFVHYDKENNKVIPLVKDDFGTEKHVFPGLVKTNEPFDIVKRFVYDREIFTEVEMSLELDDYTEDTVSSSREKMNLIDKKEEIKKEDININMHKSILDVDETRKLRSGIYENIVRTGTVGEGSCLFHSILKGLDNEYSKMTQSKKQLYVKQIREKIANDLTLEIYQNISEGELAQLQTSEQVNKMLQEFYNFVENPKKVLKDGKLKNFFGNIIENNIIAYNIITSVIEYDEMEKIQMSAFSSGKFEQNVKKWKDLATQAFLEEVGELGVDQQKIDICVRKLHDLIDMIYLTSLENSYTKFKDDLKNCYKWVGNDMIQLISDYFDIDIYFINTNTGDPYPMGACDTTMSGKRNSVVVGWVNESHFESIGIYTETSKNKGNIKRLFEPTDPFILRLRELVC